MADIYKQEFDIVEEDPPEFIADRQRFAVIAVTKPFYTKCDDTNEKNEKTEIAENSQLQKMHIALKVRGSFYYEKDANELAKTISSKDNRYDIFVCPLGKWLLLPPDVSKIDDQQHQDTILSQVLSNHDNEAIKQKADFEARKNELMTT